MQVPFKTSLVVVPLLLTLIVALLLTSGCELSLILEVENETDQTLTMGIDGAYYFNALPHTTTKGTTTLTNALAFFVEGVNKDGEILFSKYFSHTELRNTTLRVIIPPKEEKPYLPLRCKSSA